MSKTNGNANGHSNGQHIVSGATAKGTYSTAPTKGDPYEYQVGFGNRFASEALAGVLPVAQNQPQKVKYDLYTEGITGASFVSPRVENTSIFLYRIYPSVAHDGFEELPDVPDFENNFTPLNPRVHLSPTQLSWSPPPLPPPISPTTPADQKIDFIQGMKTMAGNGDPTQREGIAIHMYAANASMAKKAFCNTDGDFLILPQIGRLDIQTEMGRMMVRVGELCVIQRGIKWKVVLPDGPSRGYIQEVYGVHYELPELGPLGGYGLANIRDFESPVAAFDIDQTAWEIVYKLGGKFHLCKQNHTPFDVVAWHGNYVPYKYALEKFVHVGSISVDHIDPSIFCVLTAKSKTQNLPLADFLIFKERWDVADHTYRPPYFHRNSASEFLGMIIGGGGGRSSDFGPGSCSLETGFCPHGMPPEACKAGQEAELKPEYIYKDTMMIMFESSMMFAVSDYAMKSDRRIPESTEMWSKFEPSFLNHLDKINEELKATGRPEITST